MNKWSNSKREIPNYKMFKYKINRLCKDKFGPMQVSSSSPLNIITSQLINGSFFLNVFNYHHWYQVPVSINYTVVQFYIYLLFLKR